MSLQRDSTGRLSKADIARAIEVGKENKKKSK